MLINSLNVYKHINMMVLRLKRYRVKRNNMFHLILIYQIYTISILKCVNSQTLIKTHVNTTDIMLADVAKTDTETEAEAEAEAAQHNFNLYVHTDSNSNSNNNSTSISNLSNNNGNNPNDNNNNIMCGNTQKMADNCFRDLPPHLMEFLQTSKIAINEQDIASKCSVFRRGMMCFDDYTSRCIPSRNINILNNNVEGARRFFTKFCEDTNFQKDYLSHKECFSYIQEDWMHCTKTFQNILAEGLHSEKNVSEKFLEFCCARNAYETCIYNSARYKCYMNSAAFARATAQMLSDEKHFSNCRQFEVSTCSSTPVNVQLNHCHWTLWLTVTLLIMMKWHLMP